MSASTQDEVVDAVLAVSRVLVGIAVRSLAAAGQDITLPQFRVLAVIADLGPQRTSDLAAELGVNSSTATRLVDRLVRRQLVRRVAHPDDGRASLIAITGAGTRLVAAVTDHRRREVSGLLAGMTDGARRALVESLDSLRAAAGEVPAQAWSLGWTA